MAGYICKEMTVSEIMQTIEDFAMAAIRAEKAGFDGIQLHAAHATLLSQFLSPFFNKRKDHYGGSLKTELGSYQKSFRLSDWNWVGNLRLPSN